MKRKNIEFDNSVGGKELKKIKKLTFQLENDDNEDDVEITPNLVVRGANTKPVNISDNESNDSDSECETLFNDDCETINDADAEALNKFLNSDMAKDVVEGMKEAKDEVLQNMGLEEMEEFDFDSFPNLAKNLEMIKQLLPRYKKGRKFPKMVKVLPQIQEWMYVMEKLDFPSWSPTAVFYMTEQFKAKGGEGVRIYYNHFLLPYLRASISKNRRLDNLLYKTLQGALFRRQEFMTSLLLPWCGDSLSSIEADILGNVLKNSTVKVDAAAPALAIILKQIPFSKETLIVVKAMLEKKYNLAYHTINEFVEYFYRAATEDYSRFFTETGKMPLLWFQCLNLFASLYYPNLSAEGANKLFKLCKVHVHDKITEATRAYLRMCSKAEEMSVDKN